MLRRKGEPCQRTVPDYSGRLTDFEFLAYNTVFNLIEHDFKQLSATTDSLNELEHSFQRVLDAALNGADVPAEAIVSNGNQWEVVAPLLRLRKGEFLFCKRHIHVQREVAIVERLDPNSAFAKSRGLYETHMTSNDPRLLLQDFIQGQRESLRLWAHDLVAVAREKIEEQYPGHDLNRVVKAILQRCSNKTSSGLAVVPIRVQKQVTRI